VRDAPICLNVLPPLTRPEDFVVAKITPTLESDLGFKLFMMFATINIGGMAVFSLSVNLCAD